MRPPNTNLQNNSLDFLSESLEYRHGAGQQSSTFEPPSFSLQLLSDIPCPAVVGWYLTELAVLHVARRVELHEDPGPVLETDDEGLLELEDVAQPGTVYYVRLVVV